MDPVDILSRLPKNFYEQIESPKWAERKECLDALLKLCTDNSRLDPTANYGELISVLKKIISKDSNINVVGTAAKCTAAIAAGLRKKFTPFTSMLVPIVLEKFKEKKPVVATACVEAIDAMIKTTSLEAISDAIVAALDNKTPSVRIQTSLFVSRAVAASQPSQLTKKLLKDLCAALVKNMVSPDVEVRESSACALGAALKVAGDKNVMPFLNEVKDDHIKMEKIRDYCEKTVIISPTTADASEKLQQADVDAPDFAGDEGEGAQSSQKAQVQVDPWDSLEPVDVLSRLPKNFFEQIESPKWAERKECLETLLKLCIDNPKLNPTVNYGELISVLKKIISKDSNINVVGTAAKCTAAIASGLRKKFTPFTSMLVPIVLEKFKEKKPVVATACVEAIDAIFKTTSLEAICEEIVAALDNKTPSVRIQTSLFVSRSVAASHPAQLTKKLLKDLCAALVKNMGSPDAEVREAGACALGAALKVAGEKNVMLFLAEIKDDHLKMEKIKEHCEKTVVDPAISASRVAESAPKTDVTKKVETLKAPTAAAKPPAQQKIYANFKPVARPNTSADSSSSPTSQETSKSSEAEPSKKAGTSARAQSAVRKPGETTKSKKESDPAADGSPLIDTNQKSQRFQEEKTLKVLKWNFTTPTEEHVEQLQNQLGTVCKPALFTLLFTTNFKQHLKAIEILASCIETSPDATVGASDLFLKWSTLRFFETNPSVLTKTLEYLQLLLQLLVDYKIELHDYEIGAFLPYLLLKAGDQKDAVRQEVRKLIHKLTLLHPATKIFPLILEGCKATKNSRQKAESLDQLGSLIDLFGVSVCGTPPQASLRALAQNIGDKDNAVRNAALNAVVAAYNQMGDKVHKIIGSMNEKDFAMLQERIKRSSKLKPNPAPSISAATAAVVRPTTAPGPSASRQSPARAASPTPAKSSRVEQNDFVETKMLDFSGNEDEYEKGLYRLELSKIFDKQQLQMKNKILQKPEMSLRPDVAKNLEHPFLMPKVKQQPCPSPNVRRSPASANVNGILQNDILATLDATISQITSSSISTAVQSLVQLDEILKDGSKSHFLTGKIDQLLMAVYFQLRLACTTHMKDNNIDQTDVLRVYRHLVVVLLSLCSAGNLIAEAAEGSLKDLVCQLLTVLIDERLSSTNEGSELIRSINMLIVNLVSKSDHTSCLVALLRLLRDTLHSQTSSAKFQDLVMRCIWKLSRQLPTFADQMRLDRVIAECHNFFVDFPTASWKNRASNTPLRTVKTILNSLCSIFGDKILDHVNLVERAEYSEAVLYMKKCLGEIYARGVDGSQPNGSNVTSSNGESKDEQFQRNLETKKEASRILKRVGTKETTKQGLVELYDFLQQNPDFDMEQYYRKISVEFRDYILKGLKKLAKEKSKSKPSNAPDGAPTSENYVLTSEGGINSIEKLQRLRQKCGLAPARASTVVKRNVAENNFILPNVQSGMTSSDDERLSRQPSDGNNNNRNDDVVAESQVDLLMMDDINDLRERLEKVKRGGAF